jgi:LysR family transcriptional regulator, regulator for metE and metH
MLAEVLLYDKLILRYISIKLFHMKIGWHHFTMLMTIRNTGSLSAAARSLGLTQSAATHQVKEAERRLGIALLIRRGRSVALTRAGESLADAAATCAPVLAEAEAKAQELGHGDAPRLRLAVGIQDGLPWAGDLFAALGRRASPIRLDLVQTGRDMPAQSVHQGKADAAIELGDAAFPGLKRELIAKDELVGIVHRAHVCAARGRMLASEIVDDPYLAHALTPQRGFEFETFFKPARQVPRYIARIESLAAIIALVADGSGVSIQPRSAIRHAATATAGRIVAVPLSPAPIELPWYLHMHPAALALHGEHVMDEIAAVLRPHFRP